MSAEPAATPRKKHSPEVRKKMREAKLQMWAAFSPEERAERLAKAALTWKRNQQLKAIRDGRLRSSRSDATFTVDEDFDEVL